MHGLPNLENKHNDCTARIQPIVEANNAPKLDALCGHTGQGRRGITRGVALPSLARLIVRARTTRADCILRATGANVARGEERPPRVRASASADGEGAQEGGTCTPAKASPNVHPRPGGSSFCEGVQEPQPSPPGGGRHAGNLPGYPVRPPFPVGQRGATGPGRTFLLCQFGVGREIRAKGSDARGLIQDAQAAPPKPQKTPPTPGA
nr:uncharacterized protein LOC113822829 [Penaeus vannamei]